MGFNSSCIAFICENENKLLEKLHLKNTGSKTEIFYPKDKKIEIGTKALKLWKTANQDDRTELWKDIARSKIFKGKSVEFVLDALGEPDTYFLDPHIATYLLGSGQELNVCFENNIYEMMLMKGPGRQLL